VEVEKKYSERTLRRMRQLYLMFNNEKWSPLVTKLTWSHYIVLLEERIKQKEYERLPKETKNKLIKKEKSEVKDFVKNPIFILTTFRSSHIYHLLISIITK